MNINRHNIDLHTHKEDSSLKYTPRDRTFLACAPTKSVLSQKSSCGRKSRLGHYGICARILAVSAALLIAGAISAISPPESWADASLLRPIANACSKYSEREGCKKATKKALEGEGGGAKWLAALPQEQRRVARRALSVVGSPYRYGGASPSGFDCSGLVYYSYQAIGRDMPRSSYTLAAQGRKIQRDSLQAGDILLFGHGSSPGHAALYLGSGWFIHSPQSGEYVRLNHLSEPRFSERLVGMRRYLRTQAPQASVRHYTTQPRPPKSFIATTLPAAAAFAGGTTLMLGNTPRRPTVISKHPIYGVR